MPVAFTYLIVLVLFAPVSNFHFLDCCFFHRRLLPELFFAWPIYGFVFQLTLPSAEKELTTSPQAARTASSPFFLPDEGRNPSQSPERMRFWCLEACRFGRALNGFRYGLLSTNAIETLCGWECGSGGAVLQSPVRGIARGARLYDFCRGGEPQERKGSGMVHGAPTNRPSSALSVAESADRTWE